MSKRSSTSKTIIVDAAEAETTKAKFQFSHWYDYIAINDD